MLASVRYFIGGVRHSTLNDANTARLRLLHCNYHYPTSQQPRAERITPCTRSFLPSQQTIAQRWGDAAGECGIYEGT